MEKENKKGITIFVTKPENTDMEERFLSFEDKQPEDIFQEMKDILECKDIETINFPAPLENIIILVDMEMLTNESKYNFSLLGLPVFGNAIFVQQDNGAIITINPELGVYLKRILEDMKIKERTDGKYDKINSTNKKEFVEYFMSDKEIIDEDNEEEE